MPRRPSPIVLAAALLALASPVAAAPAPPSGGAGGVNADHLGGAITACGRIVEFTAPMVGTDGSLTVSGIVDASDHSFVVDEAATVDPLIAGLAAAGDWTCLALTGDGMGILTDLAVGDTEVCAQLSIESGTFVLVPEPLEAFTTVVLDGDAGALIAADPALDEPLTSIAMTDIAAEACLAFDLAADGTLAAILLDYGLAPIACGRVDGTPIPYRDPASQPFPEGLEVGVAGFFIDATLLEGPDLDVMSFHLDAGIDLCLLAEIADNAVATAALSSADPAVCGELEVVGGLVNVDGVVVSQGLTGINFAEPSPSAITQACWRVLTPARGELTICGRVDGVDADARTFTIAGVTFHLETAIDAVDVAGATGVDLAGPDPFQPFGAANPAVLAATSGCPDIAAPTPAALPDTAAGAGAADIQAWLVAACVAFLVGSTSVIAFARVRRR